MKRKAKCKLCGFEAEGRGFDELNYKMSNHYIEHHKDYLKEQGELKQQADKEYRELENKYPTLKKGIGNFRIQMQMDNGNLEFGRYYQYYPKLKEGSFTGLKEEK